MNNIEKQLEAILTRRQLFGRTAEGIGIAALASLLNPAAFAETGRAPGFYGALAGPQFPVKAKRIIYLYQSGAPSHIDLFDWKPAMAKYRGEDLPASIRNGQRLTGMTANQKHFPVAPTIFKFSQHGKNGTWFSELLPHTADMADDICVMKTVWTEAINHDPADTYTQTGAQLPGRPSIGSWVSYGLGTENQDMPAYIVLISQGTGNLTDQPLEARYWASGFLPSVNQGIQLRSEGSPILYLDNPAGEDRSLRHHMLEAVERLNEQAASEFHDPEINTRIAQYEMAYKMQTAVPELMDLSNEPESVFEMYGPEARKPGTFAANCLLARRLSEKGVRFVQLFHRGWDQHSNLPAQIRNQCMDTDQASAALLKDLKQRGMLEDTLVVWGGEFGRTVYSQGDLTATNYGRDHHGRCFTRWMAGGGIKGGITWGETDDFCYNIVRDPVHIHDFNATILRCLGINHTMLTFPYQGREYRLTDVAGNIVNDVLA